MVAHLKEHILEGHAMSCPVRGCTNVFKTKFSFTSHMSRKHRNFSNTVSGLYRHVASPSSSVQRDVTSDDFTSLVNQVH